ncbi:MAG: YigZ family protein [Clostridia bacterium]|nr:YigZ family protein [Clostridia bacterium]
MKKFLSVARQVSHEILIRRSRFIAHVIPAADEQEAENHFNRLQEKYSDATHNVFAWQVGLDKTMQRCSDDGEPSGTAGRPVLEVIKQNDLVNVLIVVTRYFGGVKLGAAGLVRAYSQSAREGIEKAGIVCKALHMEYAITVDYPLWGQIQREVESWGKITETDYQDKVTFNILIAEDKKVDFKNMMRNLTSDKMEIQELGLTFSQI